MSSKEELEKLTVNQLKEKLKGRKLTSSGTKSELVNRLYESIVAEEKLLEATGSGMDLNDVDVDEVLGYDERKSDDVPERQEEAPKDPKPSDSIPISTGASANGSTNDTPKPTAGGSDGEPKEKNASEEQKETESGANGSAKSEGEAGTGDEDKTKSQKKVMLKTAARLGLPIGDANVKKSDRAARFGMTSSDEAKTKRAERFGLPAASAVTNTTATDEKVAERAKRFGLPMKRSSSPTGQDKEALEKRAKRFLDNDPDALKKKARAERFGLATSS